MMDRDEDEFTEPVESVCPGWYLAEGTNRKAWTALVEHAVRRPIEFPTFD